MIAPRQLLVKYATEAFRGRADMPLMASLDAITQEEASWQASASVPSIEQIVRHIAWAKSRFCQEGFGRPMGIVDDSVDSHGDSAGLANEFPCGAGWGLALKPGIRGAIELLEAAQGTFLDCLESCSDESLEQPIPTRHGKTAANFFWIMTMHDLYHAGQIRTRRTMFAAWRQRS